MSRLEDAIKGACEDQKDELRRFAATGDKAHAARVHFESCPGCMEALEEAALHVARNPPAALVEGNRPWVVAIYVGARVLPAIAIGVLLLTIGTTLSRDDRAMTEAERMEARVRFARMPGRPDICVAALPGVGGFGPTFLGAERCERVRGRVESDENLAWRLRDFSVVRIRGTDTCLAHAGGRTPGFIIPCGEDD